MAFVYIGLGSNLGNRADNIRRAVALLEKRIGRMAACSSIIETEPEGFVSDHRFLNAVASFETRLAPDALLNETQDIERELGRTQKSLDGIYHDRSIDIDLLTYQVEGCPIEVQTPRLTLPHPRMTERDFVLKPLREICPKL